MQNCGFGWCNNIMTATLAANVQMAQLPVTNLLSPQGAASLGWRVPGTAATLTISHLPASPWRAFGLFRTNLSASASMSAYVLSGGSLVWQGEAQAVANGQILLVADRPVMGDTARIQITDGHNPDGYLSIPLAYAGPIWQPVRNYSTDSTFGRTVGQDSITSLGGQDYVSTRWYQRKYTISHQSLGDADAAVLDQILLAAAADRNILFVPDPSADPATLAAQALYGRLSAGSDLSNPFGTADRHKISLTLTERL